MSIKPHIIVNMIKKKKNKEEEEDMLIASCGHVDKVANNIAQLNENVKVFARGKL